MLLPRSSPSRPSRLPVSPLNFAQCAAPRSAAHTVRHRSLVRCPWAAWTPVSAAPDSMNGLLLVWLWSKTWHFWSPVLPPMRRNPHAHFSISYAWMLGRLSADVTGEVQAGRMLCKGEPKAFIIETEGFKALRWCVRRHALACLLLFLLLAQSAGLSWRVRLNVVMMT